MQFLSRLLYKGFSPYYFARKNIFNLTNYSEYRKRRAYVPVADQIALEAIRHDGWYKISLDHKLLDEVVNYCQKLEVDGYPGDTPPSAAGGKDFWTLLVDQSNANEHPVLLEFAKCRALKDLASSYLGEEAVLSNLTLMKSFPTHRKIKHSQLWHLDADDDRILLFYVYCRDVDDDAGPFMLVSKAQMPKSWLPRFFRKYGYSDEEFSKLKGEGAITSVVGPAGTVFACDTANTYHCGSRCNSKSRLALSVRYTTRAGLYPVHPL